MNVFEFTDYRSFLKRALPVAGPGRGARTKLAEALGCQNGFVSLVLSGGAHFSLEHAVKISKFLQHDHEEREFFLLLVHLARAGSKELENYYQENIQKILGARREIKSRIKEQSTLNDADRLHYYSSWHFTAVHMCLLIPSLRSKEAMAHYLHLSPQIIANVLKFFVTCGLAIQKGGLFYCDPNTRIHLPADSPLVAKHHTNWRMRAIDSLDRNGKVDLHYSSVMSISQDAAEKIRAILLQAIENCEPVIRDAKDEGIYTVTLDLFGIGDATE